MTSRYSRCPSCGHKKVISKYNHYDGYVLTCTCTDCDWYAFRSGNDSADVEERQRWAAANDDTWDGRNR